MLDYLFLVKFGKIITKHHQFLPKSEKSSLFASDSPNAGNNECQNIETYFPNNNWNNLLLFERDFSNFLGIF